MGVSVCTQCGRNVAVRHARACIYCGAALPEAPPEPAAATREEPLASAVRAAFVLVARCRTEGDLAPALPFLGESVAEELAQEIAQDRRSAVHHVIDRVTVGAVVLHDAPPVQRTARIDAVYAEYWQDLGSRMILRGLRGAKPHREIWQLAPLAAGPGAAAAVSGDRCSGCGAPLGAALDGRCSYCGLCAQTNRLGALVVGIQREDPGRIYEEWKQKLGAQLAQLPERDDDPVIGFLRLLKGLYE